MALGIAAGDAGEAIQIHTVDSGGNVGRYTAIAIGSDGLPVISYYHVDAQELRIAHCDDPTCATATIRVASDYGDSGQFSSIAIGSDDLPIISFFEATEGALRAVHCSDLLCDEKVNWIPDPDLNDVVGIGSSIAIAPDGYPMIAYTNIDADLVMVADCISLTCIIPTRTPIADAGSAGGDPAIVIGSADLALIAFYDLSGGGGTGDLSVVECKNAACTSFEVHHVDTPGNVGKYPSMAIGSDDLGIIAYQDAASARLKVAHCTVASCSSADARTLDPQQESGERTAIAIGPDGLATIVYWADSFDGGVLKLAHCDDLACTSARISVLTEIGSNGGYASIAFDGDGHPVISFYDQHTGDLRVAYPGVHSDGFESGDLGAWVSSGT